MNSVAIAERPQAAPPPSRTIPFIDFHRLPTDTPEVDTNLQPDVLITAVELPALACARNSRYRKVRDRASYAFALVSVAAALESEGARQSPRGDSEPPAETFGPFGMADRLNWLKAKKRRRNTSSQRRISGRS